MVKKVKFNLKPATKAQMRSRSKMTLFKTLYYPTNAQIYNSKIQLELYKIFKIFKIVPTCFGLQGIHHQGALYSAWLKLQ